MLLRLSGLLLCRATGNFVVYSEFPKSIEFPTWKPANNLS